ncbi:MAG: peptidylprolyl isomerase [Candidatus Pelagadaptatus aseana]|uniref:peptidylprolyl isomerase n=1 Tax=Candidatus Pelagadaptatus aseana TaxID=3120508 RepID=UPI0039B34045
MKQTLLKSLCKTLCAGSLLLSSLLHAETIPLDKVIAVVDDDVIMASEIHQRVQMVTSQLRAKGTQLPPMNVIQRQVLDQLILESLQLQLGDRAGVTVSEAEIDQQIQRIKDSNNLSDDAFREQLVRDGISYTALRDQLRRDIIIDQVQRGSVNRRIKISEQEVKNFLKSKQGQFWASPDYNLGHLIIHVPSTATTAEQQALQDKVEDIHRRLLAGEDFRTLAISESKGRDALKGGDMGWRKLSQLPDLIAEGLKGVKKGEITQPLRSGAGFHILKVYDTRGSSEKVIDQAKVRHILLETNAILNDQQAEAKLTEIRQEILDGADFAELAREHSDDTGTVLNGGDLGWSLPGKFVPEFERTIEATATGKISLPFRSQFGWHILTVDERRSQDMSEQVRINQATRMLRNRRFEEERVNWLQDIHRKAFIDIRS